MKLEGGHLELRFSVYKISEKEKFELQIEAIKLSYNFNCSYSLRVGYLSYTWKL